jgi:CHAT domain-containing protein/Tfp pilus assembly protein PilF
MRRIRWLLVLALALAGLVGEPRELRADKSDDLRSQVNKELLKAQVLIYDELRYAEAIAVAERALSLSEELARLKRVTFTGLPKDAPWAVTDSFNKVARSLELLYVARLASGDYVRPEPLRLRLLAMEEQESTWVSTGAADGSRHALGRLYLKRGEYARAEPLLRRVVDACDKPSSRATSCTPSRAALGELRLAMGDDQGAEPLLQRALKDVYTFEEQTDPTFRINLAELHLSRGDERSAEPLLQRALDEVRPKDKTRSLRRAQALVALAAFYVKTDLPARAEPLYQEALAIQERVYGREHPDIAVSLDGLGQIYLESGAPARAEPLLVRALALQDKAYGPPFPSKAVTLRLLGDLRVQSGDRRAAEPFYQRALEARERCFGPDHVLVAEALTSLGDLHLRGGDLQQAEPLYRRALAIREARLGPDHRTLADPLDRIAELSLRMGKAAPALDALERSAPLRDRGAAAAFASASEQQKRAYITSLGHQTDLIFSLRTEGAPVEPRAANLMLTAVLRRKGRLLDALADSRAALRDRLSPDDRTLLNELVALQSRIVDLIVNGPGGVPIDDHRKAIEELERQKQRLEAEVSKRSAALRTDDPMVAVPQVQAVIPDGAALVEIVVYTPVTPASGQRKGNPRVVAHVLRDRGGVAIADLGDAAEIEARTRELRAALSEPTRDPRAVARAFYQKVMQPLRAELGETRWVLLSPDGALNLVPFGALIDDAGRYLIETTQVTYLTSGRDLLRYTFNETPKEPGLEALVIGAPDFGDPKKKHSRFRPEAAIATGKRSVDMSAIRFSPLPGTATEAQAIGAAISGAKVLLGAEATEAAIKAVKHPRILHLASHGFFLPDQRAKGPPGQGPLAPASLENPLLRAGVALASANQPVPGQEDGILTALEASGLDLYGTKLVVLSACETGVGEATNGDGVYGLRRALVMAGAQTQVMSLWTISDEGTRELMVAYYQGLQQGGGRSEAMRKVALSMLANPKRAHPYYWASFIVSGDGGTLDGKDAPPESFRAARVANGPRGCSCAVVGEGRGGRAGLLVAAIGVFVWLWRYAVGPRGYRCSRGS